MAERSIKEDNERLIDTNIRLRKYWQDIVHKLNTVKESYEPEKTKKLEDFERFCKDLQGKKSKLLEEYTELERQIALRKDIYYNLVHRQDELAERSHEIAEENSKLTLRESFVRDLEEKWREKAGVR